MATKRYTPLDDPPSASSDEDETEDEQEIITQKSIHQSSSSESEEEEESESEEETDKPLQNSLENPQLQNPNSESESDSETEKPKTISLNNSSSIYEFDSDIRSPTASDFAIKPSKKVNETPLSKPLLSKRSFSGSEIKENKKVKVLNGEVDDEKKAVNKRVWSVDDELLLLQTFIDYNSKIGCSPLQDMDGFYKFTMNCLPGYATKSQLYEKVRRLKKKFRVTAEKVGGNGEGNVFSRPHEKKLFEISSKIWGVDGCESVNVNAGGGGSTAKGKVRVPKAVKPKVVKPEIVKAESGKAEVEVKEMEEDDDDDDEKVERVEEFETRYPYWNAGLRSEVSSALKFPAGVVKLVKENLSLIGEDKAKEMNEKWEAIFDNEVKLRKRRIALLSNVGDLENA